MKSKVNKIPYFLKRQIYYFAIIYYKLKCPSLSVCLTNKLGLNCDFEASVKLYPHVELSNTHIGKYTYITNRTKISNCDIGKFCSLGPECLIGLGTHPTKTAVSTHPSFYSQEGQSKIVFSDGNYFTENEKTIIGNDVWIGARVAILGGINVGDGAIIGAGAVVTKDVPDYAIVTGVPAKITRYRFTEEQIEFLKTFKWWNKNKKWLMENWKSFLDIETFIENANENK